MSTNPPLRLNQSINHCDWSPLIFLDPSSTFSTPPELLLFRHLFVLFKYVDVLHRFQFQVCLRPPSWQGLCESWINLWNNLLQRHFCSVFLMSTNLVLNYPTYVCHTYMSCMSYLCHTFTVPLCVEIYLQAVWTVCGQVTFQIHWMKIG
jgi:hypothetical protein